MTGRVGVALVAVVLVTTLGSRHRSTPPAHASDASAPVLARSSAFAQSARHVELPPLRRATHSSGPARIRGVVREQGVPVPDAAIWTARLPQPGRASHDESTNADERARTDAHGFFLLDDLPPGEIAMWAVHDGRASTLVQPLSLGTGERLDGVELELTGAAIAAGIVVDDRGDRASAAVTAFVDGLALAHADADTDSTFRFDWLPDERLTFVATAADEADRARRAKLTVDHASTSILLRLRDAPASLVVEVVDEAGVIDPGAWVYASTSIDSEGTNVAGDGTASFQHLTGKISLFANDDSRELASDTIEVELEDDRPRTVRLALEPAICGKGRVLDSSGAPASGMVELTAASSSVTQLVMLDEGAYRFCLARAGRYALHYSSPVVTGPGRLFGEVPLDVDLTQGRTVWPDVRLPAPRAVHALVVDESGSPTDAFIRVEASDRASDAGFVPLDGSGRATFNVLGPIVLRGAAPTAQSEPVQVPDGGGDVTLVLAPFGDVEVLLRGAPSGTMLRCGTQPWEALDATAVAGLSCHAGDTLEVKAGDEQRRFSVPVDLDETAYAELRWN